MGKTYKESYKGSKQSIEAEKYYAKKRTKHSKMDPYKRNKMVG